MVNKSRVHLYLNETDMNNLDELNISLGISKSKIVSMLVNSLYENKEKLVSIEDVLSKTLNQ